MTWRSSWRLRIICKEEGRATMAVLHCTQHKPSNSNRFFRCRTRDNSLILNNRKIKRSLSFEKVKNRFRQYEEDESKLRADELKRGSRTLTSENRESVVWTLSTWRESERCKSRNKRRTEAAWIELILVTAENDHKAKECKGYET